MAAKNANTKVVNPDLMAKALAKVICDGDIVNFRLLFLPFSPARKDSTERFETEKYAYLLPDEATEGSRAFRQAHDLVRVPATWSHIQRELDANRPAQLPSELVLALADHAVRLGKYTSAAQAYEMLRVRARMQAEFYQEADAVLDQPTSAGPADLKRAVHGYLIATGLEYNYAAFPEPLPAVPDFQTRALMLHGDYPVRPEDCVALQEPNQFLQIGIGYLLSPEAAARLEARPSDIRIAFLKQLVNECDPDWREFVHRFREGLDMAREFCRPVAAAGAAEGSAAGASPASSSRLAEEIAAQRHEDPRRIPAHLLGRTIAEGEWWQYLKELAYEHPAAALFVSRQIAGDVEIIVPRYREDSPAPQALGLIPGGGI